MTVSETTAGRTPAAGDTGKGAGVPEPPWRRPARVAARRTPLSRDALVEAALRVLDRVIGEIDLPALDPARWEEQLKDLFRRARQVLKRHGQVARISLGRIPVGPHALEVMEWQFALLREAGLPDPVVAHAGDILALYLGAYAFEESLGLTPPGGAEMPPEQAVEMIGGYFASLPPDRFPNVVALAGNGALMSGGPDERFEFGLDLLVRGLAAHAPKRASKGASRARRARTAPTSAP